MRSVVDCDKISTRDHPSDSRRTSGQVNELGRPIILQPSDMPAYREGFIHLLYAIILAQFVIIAILLGGFSNQYLADDYFRAWVNSNYSWLGLFLQGQVDALLVGMALAATVLIIQHMRREEELRSVIRPPLSEELVSSEASQPSSIPNAASIEESRREQPGDVLAELEKSD